MGLAESAIKSLIAESKSPLSYDARQKWMFGQADRIKARFVEKYEAGEQSHNSDLGQVTISQLLNEMEAEALDQLAYVAELRRRINQ